MQFKDVKIADASLLQLRVFAEMGLGMDVPKTANADQIRKMIANVHEGDTINVPVRGDDAAEEGTDSAPPAPAVDTARPAAVAPAAVEMDEAALISAFERLDIDSRKDPKITIQIHNQAGKGGERPVFVGVNGVGMLLPRNKQITIPYRYFLALTDALAIDYEQVPDEENPGRPDKLIEREMHSYPFTVHHQPSQAELDAWKRWKEEMQRKAVAAKRAAKARAA